MRVGWICEGGGRLGWGHVGRGRALLEEAPAGSALLLGQGFGEIEAWCRDTGIHLPLRPWAGEGAPCDVARCPFDVLVVDHYTLDDGWIRAAAAHRPVFVVDDWMRGRVAATGLVNANVGAAPADYPGSEVDAWLTGAEHALVRREIRELEMLPPVDGPAARVLLTLGGSDPEGRTAQVAAALVELDWYRAGGALTVVLGASYRGPVPWEGWDAERRARLEVVRQPGDFARRMAAADLVVCGASTTTYEAATLGRPLLPLAIVDNQARIAVEWQKRGVGRALAVWNPGWLESLADEAARLAGDGEARRDAARAAAAVTDGRGVFRVLEACARQVERAGAAR